MNYPNLAISLLVYLNNKERKEYAIQTIQGLKNNLVYDGSIGWYVAEGYGNENDLNCILNELNDCKVIGVHSEKMTPGANWNRALVNCYQKTGYVLMMEEDWVLPEQFDITPYVQLLNDKEDVCMVRFGTLTLGMICHVKGHAGRHYLEMDHKPQYAFSGNPHLRHKRLNKAIGLYNEEISPSPGDVEIDFDYRFRQQNDLKIWRPADIPGYGIFRHVGAVQSYKVD